MIKRFEVSEETTLQEVFEYIKVKYNEIPDLEDRENFLKAIVREVDYENRQKLRQYIVEGGRYYGGHYIIPENKTKGYYGVEDIDVVNYFLEQTVPLMEEDELIEMLLSDLMHKKTMSALNQDDVDFLTEFARVCDYIGGLPTSYSLQAQDLSVEIREVLNRGYWTGGKYIYLEDDLANTCFKNNLFVKMNTLKDIEERNEFTNLDKKRIIEIYGSLCLKRGVLPIFGYDNSEVLRNKGYIDSNLSVENYKTLLDTIKNKIVKIPPSPYQITGEQNLPLLFEYIENWEDFITNDDNLDGIIKDILRVDLDVNRLNIKHPLQYCLKYNVAPIIMCNMCDEKVYRLVKEQIGSDRILELYLEQIFKCYECMKEMNNSILTHYTKLYDIEPEYYVTAYNIHREVLRLSLLNYELKYRLIRVVCDEFIQQAPKWRREKEYKKEVKDLINLLDEILINPNECDKAISMIDKFMRKLMRSV